MKDTSDWIELRNKLQSPTFELLVNLGYEFALKAKRTRQQLQRGHTNWDLITEIEGIMFRVVGEYRRLISEVKNNPAELAKLESDIQITLAPLLMKGRSGGSFQILQSARREGGESVELTVNMHIMTFGAFIETRIFDKLNRLLKKRDDFLLREFSEQSIAEAGMLPKEEKTTEQEGEQ